MCLWDHLGWTQVLLFLSERKQKENVNLVKKTTSRQIPSLLSAGMMAFMRRCRQKTVCKSSLWSQDPLSLSVQRSRHQLWASVRPAPAPPRPRHMGWRSIFQQLSVQIHEGLVYVTHYGTARSPVWAQQYRHRLLPVAERDAGALRREATQNSQQQ